LIKPDADAALRMVNREFPRIPVGHFVSFPNAGPAGPQSETLWHSWLFPLLSTFRFPFSTFIFPLSAFILHPSSFILHPSAFSLQPSAFSLQPSAFSLQPSAFSLQPSAFSLQPSAFDSIPSIPNGIAIFTCVSLAYKREAVKRKFRGRPMPGA
jgi:hypothetical protein